MMTRRMMVAVLMSGLPALAVRAQNETPQQMIGAFVRALEQAMRAGPRTAFRTRFDQLAPLVDRVFDLETILSVSVGARWAGLDADVRAMLRSVFRSYTIASFVANFDQYDGEVFEIDSATRAVGADLVVGTRIVPRTGSAKRLDYLMRQSGSEWRVVDVLADGTISRVAVQRSDFRALLGRDNNTGALIASLRRKVADLSGGTVT